MDLKWTEVLKGKARVFADIHAECCEIIAILEKGVKDARRRKAKKEREGKASRNRT